MTHVFVKHPWIWIVLFFLAFLLLWTWFIQLAVTHAPPVIHPPSIGSTTSH